MVELLKTIYTNPYQRQESKRQYQALRITNGQPFHAFRPEFQRLAAEAGVPQPDLVDDLYEKLIPGLKQALMLTRRTADFNTFCDLAAGIDNDLRRLNSERAIRRVTIATVPMLPPAPVARPVYRPSQPATTATDRKPDTILQRNLDSTPRPEPAILKCYNCNKAGHIARECMAPRKDVDLKEIEDHEEYDSDEQGKDHA